MTILGAADDDKLRAVLDSLGYDLEPSILMGGWATNARVGGEISHDIDLIITDQNLRQKLPQRLTEQRESVAQRRPKGARQCRWNPRRRLLPYESKLGSKLLLDVGVLTRYIDPDLKVEGWLILTPDAHIATKIAALIDRQATEQGRKDARELVALINKGGDAARVPKCSWPRRGDRRATSRDT